jgi:hypothetical protein
MCGSCYFNLIIMTRLSPFQILMKEKEVTEDVHIEVTPRDHSEGGLDLEVARIASGNLMTSNGLDVAKPVPRETSDDADHAGETEV